MLILDLVTPHTAGPRDTPAWGGGTGVSEGPSCPKLEVGSCSLELFFHPALHDRHPGLGQPLPWERL